ncbi:MAG: hypothetical protein GXP61_08195 [Epsilonproteobacteria bacterium]|nr:hypothetical protein [Campylobacterota bacterium]
MISKIELLSIIGDEMKPSVLALVSKLPIIPSKFEIIKGRKIPFYNKTEMIHALKMRKSRAGSTAHITKLEMIERLEG